MEGFRKNGLLECEILIAHPGIVILRAERKVADQICIEGIFFFIPGATVLLPPRIWMLGHDVLDIQGRSIHFSRSLVVLDPLQNRADAHQ